MGPECRNGPLSIDNEADGIAYPIRTKRQPPRTLPSDVGHIDSPQVPISSGTAMTSPPATISLDGDQEKTKTPINSPHGGLATSSLAKIPHTVLVQPCVIMEIFTLDAMECDGPVQSTPETTPTMPLVL
ncbi:hypothetical protein Salat_0517100 [Sesamum alatum]|uniref:Uncharacterized protein n=1 Tax=Sesamum alatum TaxID=300844 RepID=A0AAE1Z4G6_9LAMI|nr:hypothetical protein Salat_0517100 [Sesamum alatum]